MAKKSSKEKYALQIERLQKQLENMRQALDGKLPEEAYDKYLPPAPDASSLIVAVGLVFLLVVAVFVFLHFYL